MEGMIFNIQKFSLHDGPGIRTTVFFKGCPLRCRWCANPESQLHRIQLMHHEERCTKCLCCINQCQHQGIQFKNGKIALDQTRCTGCLKCVSACIHHALSSEGEMKSVEEIVRICLQDKDFYLESGGGITISGGEGMAQPEFLKELVQRLKKEGLHVAIETTGFVNPDQFQELAGLFDLLLFDIKHYDSQCHQSQTGVDNTLILNNLYQALQRGINILPRIPVIPGFNDSLYDAEQFAVLLNNIGINQVQLLPFHQFGEKKYENLGIQYDYKNKKALHAEELKAYQKRFIKAGIDCFF